MKKFKITLFNQLAGALLLACVLFSVGCKKDAFNEKDALQAQKDLLQFKYDQEIKLEQLRQSGSTALAQLQFNFAVQQNALNLKLTDSLNRLCQKYVDSLTKARASYNDSVSRTNANKRDIIINVRDITTNQPIAGATVTIPTLVSSVLQGTTDANGNATFAAAGNINVPNPASALVTKAGYASGTALYSIYGSGTVAGIQTISLWNQANARNTIKGSVSIQTNFVNATAEVATGRLINVYANVFLNGAAQRYDWSALTDANGNYSISVPDLPNGFFRFSQNTFDTTARLAINGLLPGVDSIPSVQNVPATYYLGVENKFNVGGLPAQALGFPWWMPVPNGVSRYHAVTPLDSNGRAYYFKNISFNLYNNNAANTSTAFVSPFITSPSNAVSYTANGNAVTPFFPAVFAGTNNSSMDSLPARFVDILSNSDNLWTRTLSLYFFVSAGPNKTFTSVNNAQTAMPGSSSQNFVLITKRASGQVANNNYDPAAWGIINQSTAWNLVNNSSVQNKSVIGNSNINATNYDASSSAFFTGVNVSGGQTVVQNLTYGWGQLKQGVR